MESIGDKVRQLYLGLNSEQKTFLGGIPFSESINREISNFNKYLTIGLPIRKRVALGHAIEKDNKVIGYQSTTIMRNSNPTTYEKEYINLNTKLNYVQLKNIAIHQEYQGKNIATTLLNECLEFAKQLNVPLVTDVNANNIRMIKFLEKHNITNKYEWHTPKRTLMYRFSKIV